MQQKSFEFHTRILHDGQYEIKKTSIEVPIRHFDLDTELEQNVQSRIQTMRLEIEELEEKIKEKRRISQEKADKILEQVQDEAKKVLEEAEQHAFDRIQKSVQEKESVLQKTSEEVQRIKNQAEKDSDEIKEIANKDAIKIKTTAQKDGYEDGIQQGIDAGREEVKFAVGQLHGIIAETARERERILIHSETQVINLVLTMVKKVVKKLTVEHQETVIENIKAALELLRGAMTLFVRVSPHDFNFVSSFKEELVRMIEKRAELKFIEDPTVEPGGVYIETDTGDVDATIRSQLEALENQMHFYMPVKVKTPETKKREQENQKNNNLKKSEQDNIQTEKKSIPKTDFAQREEYISNTETTPNSIEPSLEEDNSNSTEPSPEEDQDNSVPIEDSTEETLAEEQNNQQVSNQDNIIQAEIIDAYKENTEQPSTSPHDDIII